MIVRPALFVNCNALPIVASTGTYIAAILPLETKNPPADVNTGKLILPVTMRLAKLIECTMVCSDG